VNERRELAPIIFKVLGATLLAYLVVPLVYLIFRIGWQEIASSFANPKTVRAVEVSLLTSFISVSVMTLFGVPLGYLLARPGFKGRQLLVSLVFVPMALHRWSVESCSCLYMGPTEWWAPCSRDTAWNW